MEWVACVGVDWGQRKHAYAVRDREGARISGEFGSSAEQVHQWVQVLRQKYPSGTIVVAVEQGRASLLYALMMYEFVALVPINPLASKSYRASRRLSGASDDALDAGLLCEFVLKHLDELRVWQADDAVTRKLRLMAENRRALVDRRTALTHALAATLEQYFPQALEWFGGERSRLLRAVLGRWPTLEDLRRVTTDELIAVMREQRCRKAPAAAQKLLDQIQRATALIDDRAIIEAAVLYVQSLMAMLTPLEEHIAQHDHAIAAVWASHPDRSIFDSLPGAGPALAPRLAVAFGLDRNRYQRAYEMQCYSGIAPVLEASGRQRWVHARRGYPTFLHQTFHEFAQASIPHCPWAKAFYRNQRERGARHHQAIRALAFRWIRILLRLWKDHQPYDDARYLAALQAKQSPLLARLAA